MGRPMSRYSWLDVSVNSTPPTETLRPHMPTEG